MVREGVFRKKKLFLCGSRSFILKMLLLRFKAQRKRKATGLVIARLDRAIHALIFPESALKWIARSSRAMTKG
jgi:hypothetical protein